MAGARKSAGRRPEIDWERIQAEYLIGGPTNSIRQIAKRHNVSHTGIQRRISAENWGLPGNFDEQVRRKVASKVAGVVATGNTKKIAEAIDAEADRRAEVIRKHKAEWEEIETLRREALDARAQKKLEDGTIDESTGTEAAFGRAKFLKIMTEATALKQRAQRQAYALDDREAAPGSGLSASLESLLDEIGSSGGAGDGTTGIGVD